MGFLGLGDSEHHHLTDNHLVKFWRYVGNSTFDRFRTECINCTLRNAMFPNEEICINDALLEKWRSFEGIEGIKKLTFNQLIATFAKEWPLPMTVKNWSVYKEILNIDGVRKVEELLRLSKSIDADGSLEGIRTQLQQLSRMLNGPSASELYACLCDSGVYEGLWRKQFIEIFPHSEVYLPPSSTSESEFRQRQLGALKIRLLSLSGVKDSPFYANFVNDLVRSAETIYLQPHEYVSFSLNGPATEQDIREHEMEIGFGIPAQLRALLLSVSGDFEFHWRAQEQRREPGSYDSGWVEWKLRDIKAVSPSDYGIDDEELDDFGWINVLHIFSFASGDFVAIGLDNEHVGHVYYYDHGSYKFTHLAESFNEFIQEMAQRDFCNLEMVLLYLGQESDSFTFKKVPKSQVPGP